jgi:hypothetical protein
MSGANDPEIKTANKYKDSDRCENNIRQDKSVKYNDSSFG